MNKQDYLREARSLAATEELDQWTALMRVFLPRLLKTSLPATLKPALTRAERHWHGQPEDLMAAKLETWQYIDTTYPQGKDLGVPEGRAARALLCVLEPGGDAEELDMTVEWFVAMVDNDEHSN